MFENNNYSYRNVNCFKTITFESNMPYPLRFMIDTDIVGMSWLNIKAGKYTIR